MFDFDDIMDVNDTADTHQDNTYTTLNQHYNEDGTFSIMHNGIETNYIHHDGAYFDHGDQVIHHNAHNTHETMVNGKVVTRVVENEMGGVDVYQDGHLVYHTMPNGEGGENIYDANMNEIGYSMANHLGGLDYVAMNGNADEIMNYADPLQHVHEYKMAKLNLED